MEYMYIAPKTSLLDYWMYRLSANFNLYVDLIDAVDNFIQAWS